MFCRWLAKYVVKPTRGLVPFPREGEIHSVSRVSEQAENRTGAHFETGLRDRERNRKPPEAARCFQVSKVGQGGGRLANMVVSDSRPCNFGVENGTSGLSGSWVVRPAKNWMVISSRFGNKEMKLDSCKGVHRGATNVSDRRVGDRCPKYCTSRGMNSPISMY